MERFRSGIAIVCSVFVLLLVLGLTSDSRGNGKSGEALFKQHCAVCHPDGGNIVNPKKTLHKKDLVANGIKSKDDIVRIMRKPGPGMNTFDERTIPDKAAREIAEYIQKTFK